MGLIPSRSSASSIENGCSDQDDQESDTWSQLPPLPDRTSAQAHHYMFKLVIIGDTGTGKSQLVARYLGESFRSGYTQSVGVDFRSKTITMDERQIRLNIWDIAGPETFLAIVKSLYDGAAGIFIVYDASNENTFNHLSRTWIKKVEVHGPPNVQLMLLGNKCDLRAEIQDGGTSVDYLTAKKFADEMKVPLFEVSAKDGTNVELAFTEMVAIAWGKMIEATNTTSGQKPIHKHN